MNGREVVIVGAARTPLGSFLGSLASVPTTTLGATAIREALRRAGVDPGAVEEVVMGNVLQAGEGQAPARQAAIYAGVSENTPCFTINKVCGSGMKAVIAGAQAIALGEHDIVVAGGMESMSNAPFYDKSARTGARMGNYQLIDGMVYDGLWDPYDNVHMGMCAEQCAVTQDISRAKQDEFSIESTRRAIESQKKGLFKDEIVPVEFTKRGEKIVVSEDDGPKLAKPDRITSLKPAFKKDGTVTAANASSINDGAAALVLMSAERAKKEGKPILGRLTGWGDAARKPVEFTIAPADAVKKVLGNASLQPKDIDLWEINEAFAVVSLANAKLLGIDPKITNLRGGAVVLGHPIGCSGARILVTLLYTMRDMNKKRGLATLCIGGGEGIAAMVER